MIVRPGGWGLRVVRQADHARLAGRMLSLFRLPELAAHPRRDALLRAIREHDNGWWEEDSAPRLDAATGGPCDFRSISGALRRAIWKRGVERYATAAPYVAALVAGHYRRVLDRVGGDEEEGRALADRQRELLEAAGATVGEAAHDDRWLALGDGLSLAVCTGEAGFLELPGFRIELVETVELSELRFEPCPLAGPTRVDLELRTIEARSYPDAAALGRALLSAPLDRLPVRLAPA